MPLTLPAPGRIKPTPRANRSLAAELTGAVTSLFDMCSRFH